MGKWCSVVGPGGPLHPSRMNMNSGFSGSKIPKCFLKRRVLGMDSALSAKKGAAWLICKIIL